MEALQDQTSETGALSVLSFWHLQHCDTLTTCSSLLKESLLSPTDWIMSKDAFSATLRDHVSRAPSENVFKIFNVEKYIVKFARNVIGLQNNVSVEPIACENPSVGSKFAANYPGRHLHISTRISHILLSVPGYLVISRDLDFDNNWARREFTPIWSQSPSSWKYSNILKWVLSIILIVKDLIDWVISMCFLLNVINQQYFIQSDH